jgi:hypothetical protein
MLSPSFVNYNPSPGKRTKKKEITKSRMYGSITSRLQNLPQGTGGGLSATRRPIGAHLKAARLLYARQPQPWIWIGKHPIILTSSSPWSCICLMNPINQVAFACFILRISSSSYFCSLSLRPIFFIYTIYNNYIIKKTNGSAPLTVTRYKNVTNVKQRKNTLAKEIT